jgi:hypothetical protein
MMAENTTEGDDMTASLLVSMAREIARNQRLAWQDVAERAMPCEPQSQNPDHKHPNDARPTPA